MPVLINFKICDNAKECGGIEACPTGALSYDDAQQTIIVDNDKCISCGKCEKECPIGAISVAKNDEEYKKLKKQIDDDKRTTKDLFVDRYGAVLLSEFFKIEDKELEEKIKKNCLTFIEIFDEELAMCLLKSIPIKQITDKISGEVMYYKIDATDEIKEKYKVSELPALLIFKNNNLLGKIEGYYSTEEIDEFEKMIQEII